MNKLSLSLAAILMAGSTAASATTFTPSVVGITGGSTNVETGDSTFSLKDIAANTAVASLVLEWAGYANYNTFGIYELGNTSNMLEIFAGSVSPGFAGSRTLTWSDDDSVSVSDGGGSADGISKLGFGFYLDGPGGTFFSQAGLNSDEADHLITYNVAGAFGLDYLLGWEDLPGLGDKDYDDMVVGVHDIMGLQSGGGSEVPVPAAAWLFGSALLGIGGLGRKKKSLNQAMAA